MRNIECLRRKAGLTQKEVSQAVGVTQGSVSQWENGASFPRADKLPLLATIFGCTIDELYDDVRAAMREGA